MKNPNQTGIIKTIGMAAFVMLLASLFITSCSKKKQGCTLAGSVNFNKDAEEDDGSCIVAGRGGDITLDVYPRFLGAPVYNREDHKDSAFVKYNTLQFPGDNAALYDYIIDGTKTMDSVCITSLKQGNYYIFVTGNDPLTGIRLKGGTSLTLTGTAGVQNLVVAVSP